MMSFGKKIIGTLRNYQGRKETTTTRPKFQDKVPSTRAKSHAEAAHELAGRLQNLLRLRWANPHQWREVESSLASGDVAEKVMQRDLTGLMQRNMWVGWCR
jgi:hypothetical protein